MLTVNYSVPLMGGRETRQRILTEHLRRWNRDVLEGMYGRKFAKRNADNPFFFVSFIETGVLYQKDHLHLIIRVPEPSAVWFEGNAKRLWNPATTDLLLERIYCANGAVEYCSKQLATYPDRIVLSNEFRKT